MSFSNYAINAGKDMLDNCMTKKTDALGQEHRAQRCHPAEV